MNTSSMSTCDIKIWRTWALAITHEAGAYTEQKFNAEKTGGEPAYKNPIKMQIDIARYSKLISPKNTGHNEEKEEKLLERCPPGHEGTKLVDKPATILDASGTIITWYLVKTVLKGREIRRAFGLSSYTVPLSRVMPLISGRSYSSEDPEGVA
ncbi:hypothetical protein BDR07DRAFT_1498863 [Suillus spraguei]|nr:hypothetical protein BDR07DRAFT_1498863 [Suillus spraguei]